MPIAVFEAKSRSMVICCPAPIATRKNSLCPIVASTIVVVCGIVQSPNIWFSAVVQVAGHRFEIEGGGDRAVESGWP